jgi:hypothetical protein
MLNHSTASGNSEVTDITLYETGVSARICYVGQWKSIDVPRKHIASIIRVEEETKQETNMKQAAQLGLLSTLKMEAIYSSEKFIGFHRNTQCYNGHQCDNLKSNITLYHFSQPVDHDGKSTELCGNIWQNHKNRQSQNTTGKWRGCSPHLVEMQAWQRFSTGVWIGCWVY